MKKITQKYVYYTICQRGQRKVEASRSRRWRRKTEETRSCQGRSENNSWTKCNKNYFVHEAARVTFNSKYLETGQGEAMEMEDLVSQDDHLRPKHDYNLLEREAQAGREGVLEERKAKAGRA